MNKNYNNYIISVIGGLTSGFIILIIPKLLKVIFDPNINIHIKIIFLVGMMLVLIWSLFFIGQRFFLEKKQRSKDLNKLIIIGVLFIIISFILDILF